MARISKPPEIRKQELIDIATKLFLEKGYENVSVRDILKEVNGAPGMFYHYFKSKQEIYSEAVEQFVNKGVYERLKIINNKSESIINRFRMLAEIIEKSVKEFYLKFHNGDSAPYEKVILIQMIDRLSEGVSELIKEAIDEKIVPSNDIINKDSAYKASVYLLHGCRGLVSNFSENHSEEEIGEAVSISMKFILNFLNVSSENIKKLLNEK